MTGALQDFTGRVVVITGGAAGIGRALGVRFAAEGSRVVLADVEAGALARTVEELAAGGEVTGVRTDVTDPASVEALAEEVYGRHGAVHVLINNAGVGAPSAKSWESTPNDWRWVHSVNVFGVAHGVQSFVPRMLAGGEPGHVVNTSSGDGAVNPLPNASVYAASKAAVSVLTECLATQLREESGGRLGVSLFLPGGGLLDTGLWTADRNRPAELARERPRGTPAVTVAQLVEMAAARGRELPVRPLDELARQVVDGIKDGVYCITDDLAEAAATLRERADLLAAGRCPTVVDAHGILT
ncbi:SDR family NAD(P)-dependent oxidoreductase [Actinomadura rugatobispora]|uniref:SDR family NAD(P)-dependent oxidoreductase n=1 Tax=Actinomadura rugatobispora TaxID=1994 RepID=A0ABW0ZTM7_9ACTN|nr:SDR family NAD(P)-dependent oxidoreductase [Actinomadura rugatobispora]